MAAAPSLHHRRLHHHLLFLLLRLLLIPLHLGSSQPAAPMSEADALLLLKSSFTNTDDLLSSWASGNPCDPNSPWDGVICLHGAVNNLRLSNMSLSGSINVDALSQLPRLRSVSFANNSFSGPIPALDRLNALKNIYLSNNQFSGAIPGHFFGKMPRLKKLWLDGNAFTGHIPDSLSTATALLELRLEDNHFDGPIPAFALPSLSSFNVSNNDLEGTIPDIYFKFDPSSFAGNKDLCGELVGGRPCTHTVTGNGRVAAIFLLALIFLCLAMYTIKTRDSRQEAVVTLGKARKEVVQSTARETTSPPESNHKAAQKKKKADQRWANKGAGGDKGGAAAAGGEQLVMVNEGKGKIGLADLMKADAEVMGNGGMGSAYKAVMANGVTVVVKRMRDMNRVGKESFDADMSRLGRLNHPNVLPPLAYHYSRRDEKLLVYEYVPKGSLLYVLHGDRGLDHASLDWPTRIKIALGMAHGLAYLHAELPFVAVPHGNLKSSNVLLSPNFEPRLVDYGFLSLVNPAQAATAMQALRSPEVVAGWPVSRRADVYCLGVLLLELLTGKFPSQYLNNVKGGTDVVQWATSTVGEGREVEILDPAIVGAAKASVPEMTRLVRIGVECAEPDPDRRLGLREAIERMEEVAAASRSHAAYVKDGVGERSARRAGSIGERSGRRSDDTCTFAKS